MTVTVTQEEIESSCPRDSWRCPVANALFRVTGLRWVVERDHCRMLANRVEYFFPSNLTAWIADFDAGRRVGPVTFEM
ncbi:MAG: hypothetical protein ACRDQZ_09275 [Mycobacteriales bacterium]